MRGAIKARMGYRTVHERSNPTSEAASLAGNLSNSPSEVLDITTTQIDSPLGFSTKSSSGSDLSASDAYELAVPLM